MGKAHDLPATHLPGELIVRNGPDRGVRRGLLVPLTIVGSGEVCDLRIIDPMVRPVHCVISVTPEGPHLRSVGGTTLVNQLPSSGRLLQAGDMLSVGPVELEVTWSLPPAPIPGAGVGVPLALAADEVPTEPEVPVDVPARKSARQQWKIIQERGRLFRERQRLLSETKEQRRHIAEARNEGEALHSEAQEELNNLRRLRRRFIKRWKRQWTTERRRLTRESERLIAERTAFLAAKAEFEATKALNERDRRQLTNSLRECRAKRLALEIELEAKQQELANREHQLHAREQVLKAEQSAFANQREALGYEIKALENRVQHLREALPVPQAMPMPEPQTKEVPDEAVPLHQLAEDLADQRQSLAELVGHVAKTLTDTRDLGTETLHELEAILRSVVDREESLQATAQHLLSEQARLEAWQARLLDSQIEADRDQEHISRREDRVARYESRLRQLIAEWQRRRNSELSAFRSQLELARNLRDQAAEAIRLADHREQELARRRENLASRELAVEIARHELGATDSEALARGERKVLALYERHAVRLEEQTARLEAERSSLAEMSRHATEQWEALARQQRNVARKQNYSDHREYQADRQEIDDSMSVLQLQAARAMAERQADDLRKELARLTKLVEQLSRTGHDTKRAA